MGKPFKSMYAVVKDEDTSTKEELKASIEKILSKVKTLNAEREKMLVEYNKLTTSIFQMNSEMENKRRILKRLNAPVRNYGNDPLDDCDID